MAVTVRVQVSGPEPVGVRVGVWMVVGVVRWVAWYPWSRLNGGGGRVLGLPEGGQMVPVAPLARDGPLGTLPQLGTDGLQHVGFAYQIAAGKKNMETQRQSETHYGFVLQPPGLLSLGSYKISYDMYNMMMI